MQGRSFDHFVGAGGQAGRHLDAEHLGRLHVNHEFELGRQHDRQIGRLLALEHAGV
jgi:hypothetical protein